MLMPRIWDDVIPTEDRDAYEKGLHGADTGFGTRPAVLVVDMSHAFVDDRYPLASEAVARPVAQAIAELLKRARGAGVPVFYTTAYAWRTPPQRGRWKGASHTHPMMERPEAHWIIPELAPASEDTVIVKAKPSGFFGTELASQLVFLGVDTLIVTGLTTSGCVRATVVDGFSYNYRVIVPEECVGDRGRVSHKVSLFEMQMKYADVLPTREVLAYLDRVPDGLLRGGDAR
jgi:maleamate amidohydrolase